MLWYLFKDCDRYFKAKAFIEASQFTCDALWWSSHSFHPWRELWVRSTLPALSLFKMKVQAFYYYHDFQLERKLLGFHVIPWHQQDQRWFFPNQFIYRAALEYNSRGFLKRCHLVNRGKWARTRKINAPLVYHDPVQALDWDRKR